MINDELQVKGNANQINDGGKSFFQDAEGNFSSGRFIKITSGIMAFITITTGVVTLIFQPNNSEIANYCFKVAGLLLATATGSEVVQKITGR